jgi:hypothetical protein
MARLSAALEEELESRLRPVAETADPRERYRLAVEAEAFHRASARRLVELRAVSAFEIHEQGDSYAKIASFVGLTRARVQQLVELGRALCQESRELHSRSARAAAWSGVLQERSSRATQRAMELAGRRRSESGGQASQRGDA